MEINKIYNQDCLIGMKQIPNESIDLIVTDPPYLISRDSNFNKGGGNEKKYGSISMDFGKWDKKDIDFFELFKEYKRILCKGGTVICFFDIFKMQTIYNIGLNLGFKQPRIGIWNKSNTVPINSKINYLSNAREYFISLTNGKKKTFNSVYDKAYYTYPIVSGKEKTSHPTQKPIKMFEDIILTNSNENDIILDTFMGSGTTAVACINTNRNFVGFETEEKYFEIANKRIKDTQSQLSLF